MTRTARQKRISRERAASKASRGKNCPTPNKNAYPCLLYTSDAADE